MDMDVITILKFEEMVALYIKIFNLNSEAKKILGKKEWSKLYSPDIEREFHSGPIETKS